MGYRISLYRCPKKDVDAIRDITDEEYEVNYDKIYAILKKEEIKYDTLANILDTGMEVRENLCSRIFTNKLKCEEDVSFYTISKDQLRNIIEKIRQRIFEYEWGNTIDYDNKIIGENIHGNLSWEKPTWDEAVRHVCRESRFDARMWANYLENEDGTKRYTNVDTSDNKWWITNGFGYRYCIFNFIHILKCFDWENDYLIAIGG